MLCGYLRQVCKSIKVQDLIDILETCKNKDAVVKCFETTNFFIHFDQDGQFVDFTKNPLGQQYGEGGTDNTCAGCGRYDHVEKACKCDGKNCLNSESLVNTEKLNEIRSRELDSSIASKNQAPTEEIKKVEENYTINSTPVEKPKMTLENYSINGVPMVEEVKIEEPTHKEISIPAKDIQTSIDNAIINTLNKMISGIKGDK